MKAMRRMLKLLSVVLILLIVAVAAFVVTFDANNYKPLIIEQVEAATGRDFRIEGDISLSVFPWVGLRVEKVYLGNDAAFRNSYLAYIAKLDLHLRLLPLLKKEVEVKTIVLHGLGLSLEVTEDGRNNWTLTPAEKAQAAPAARTGEASTGSETAPESGSFELQSLHIDGIELVSAMIRYEDRSSGTIASLANMDLQTGAITFDKPVPVQFKALFDSASPEMKGRISLQTRLRFNREFSEFDLDDLLVTLKLAAREFIPQAESIKLAADVSVRMQPQTASLKSLRLDVLGLKLLADIDISHFMQEPKIDATLELAEFSAAAVAERAGVELPPMAAADALGRLAMKTRVSLAGRRFEANDFNFRIDDSSLSGWIHVTDIDKQSLRYDLSLDHIDIDDYLPPAATGDNTGASPPVSAQAQAATGDEKIELPLDLMRSLDMQGDFRIGELAVLGYRMEQLLLRLQAGNGLIRLQPVSMRVFAGKLDTDIEIDVREAVPAYRLKLDARQIQAGPVADPFLVGVMGDTELSMQGSMDVTMDIRTRGDSLNGLKRAARGDIRFNMQQTRVKGFDPAYYMRSSAARYIADSGLGQYDALMGEYRPRQVTVFDRISSSIRLADGRAETKDFLMDSKRVKITASGYVDIMQNSLDVLSGIRLPRGKTALEKLLDEPMYVRVYGPFEAIEYKIDTARLKKSTTDVLEKEARARLEAEKQRLQEKARAEQQRLEEKARAEEARARARAEAEKKRLQEKIDAEKKRAQEKLKNKLKELF